MLFILSRSILNFFHVHFSFFFFFFEGVGNDVDRGEQWTIWEFWKQDGKIKGTYRQLNFGTYLHLRSSLCFQAQTIKQCTPLSRTIVKNPTAIVLLHLMDWSCKITEFVERKWIDIPNLKTRSCKKTKSAASIDNIRICTLKSLQ